MRRRAAAWIAIYLLLVLAPQAVLLLGEVPPGREFWWDFSMALGFAGMAMMGVQFALTARLRPLTAPFGIDIIYLFHRYLAWIALALVLVHFGILWLGYEEALGPTIDPREAPWELTAGRAALVLFALAVITSEWRKLLRLEYGLWRYAHVALATLGFAAAVAHILGIGYFTAAPVKRVLWLSVTLVWVLLLVWVRVAKPWEQKRHPWRVVAVRPERNDTWTLALEPDGHAGLKGFSPGQFAWLTLRGSPFGLREHPFSIASAPEDLPRIEFGIKALGDFTGRIGEIRPGEVAYLDAPYGVFSIDRVPDAAGFVGIVGGIGVTPMMSMLRSMAARADRRPVWLFYGNKTWEKVVFREELEALRSRLDLRLVHILEEPPEGWQGETGHVTRELLERHLSPELRPRLHHFLCGPPPMTAAAEKALHELGLPAHRVQTEVFELV
ncbi:ferredoxin reductase family protein [Roseicella aerolata]|uniref:Ferric reductase-like transmembrane domain-containing protein n=1 Tax=Roseicella aerolata TaxID=2883479 RepID=A0A9X1L9N8_9PROT|nr:ferric reductase-like transmembrane domain-containing protein [Roseicella aerolata]MCB4823944.1 ferric reductase-like transmembrane domain-containing protein [Roseicella aerolata]